MSGISLAAIKIGEIIFNLQPVETILYAGIITVVFSTLGGFRGVVLTDFFLRQKFHFATIRAIS